MAIDTAHHRLFSGCRSGLMAVSDYQAGTRRGRGPVLPGSFTWMAIERDPATR
jgi:hypothetical protein